MLCSSLLVRVWDGWNPLAKLYRSPDFLNSRRLPNRIQMPAHYILWNDLLHSNELQVFDDGCAWHWSSVSLFSSPSPVFKKQQSRLIYIWTVWYTFELCGYHSSHNSIQSSFSSLVWVLSVLYNRLDIIGTSCILTIWGCCTSDNLRKISTSFECWHH